MLPQIKTIIYTTALGPGAPYVFRHTLALARQYRAKIVAVHGIEPLSTFGQSLVEQYISHDDSAEMHKQARETVKAKLQARIEQLCTRECNGAANCENLVISVKVVDGYPAQVILDAAKECGADLIVMGAHRHSVVGEVMMGSTTRKVLHSSSLPVLVVKIPEGYTEELQ